MPAATKMVIMKYQKEAHVNAIARRAVALSCHFISDECREIQKGRQTIVPIPLIVRFGQGQHLRSLVLNFYRTKIYILITS